MNNLYTNNMNCMAAHGNQNFELNMEWEEMVVSHGNGLYKWLIVQLGASNFIHYPPSCTISQIAVE